MAAIAARCIWTFCDCSIPAPTTLSSLRLLYSLSDCSIPSPTALSHLLFHLLKELSNGSDRRALELEVERLLYP